jgi:hypothetical protein
MSELLERLKAGLASAQKRQAEVLKQFQAVQAEYNAVTQEVTGYQKVLENETRIEQQQATLRDLARETVKQLDGIEPEPTPEVNKTQVIREALGQHPGMTPADTWKAVRGQIRSRNYVYSVLKRLKDRKQIIERRGKYYLPATPKTEEESGHPTAPIQ